jgi:hypothetical protein
VVGGQDIVLITSSWNSGAEQTTLKRGLCRAELAELRHTKELLADTFT